VASLRDEDVAAKTGAGTVALADQTLPDILERARGHREVVRLNWIAYHLFVQAAVAGDVLSLDDTLEFQDRIVAAAAEQALPTRAENAIRVFESRIDGFDDSFFARVEGEDNAHAKYFIACCSANRIEIPFEDVVPDPSDLERVANEFGGTDALRDEIARIRALPTPVYYPVGFELISRTAGLMDAVFSGIREGLRDWISRNR